MSWCIAVNCSSNSFTKKRVKGLRFFQLPKSGSLKKKWGNGENIPKNPSVCELHFEENCFKTDLQVSKLLAEYSLKIKYSYNNSCIFSIRIQILLHYRITSNKRPQR